MKREFVSQEYTVATNGKGLQQSSKLNRVLTRISVFISVTGIILSVLLMTLAFNFILSPVLGTSMMTELNASGENTDSALTYKKGIAQRGDIIVTKLYLKDTSDNQTSDYNLKTRYPNVDKNGHYMYIIKRLIAVEGDKVSVERVPKDGENMPYAYDSYNYYIYINGEKLIEDYLDPDVGHHSSTNFIQLWRVLNENNTGLRRDWKATNYNDCVKDGVLTVPTGHWYFMGDNRGGNESLYNHSWDCSYLGPQNRSHSVGVCIEIISNDKSMLEYVWDKVVYYIFFGWAWQQ